MKQELMTPTNVDNNVENPNSQVGTVQKPKLPKLDDLYADKELALRQNELNILLNQPPPPSWLKYHPLLKVEGLDQNGQKAYFPLPYLPIQRVEWLLTSIFQKWSVTVKEIKQIANAVSVSITLKVQDPLSGEWIEHDGVGAMDIQTKKGASAADFTAIVSGAIPKALPAAKSYAIKDAAQCLGKLFGKDLGRADEVGYQNLESKLAEKPLNE